MSPEVQSALRAINSRFYDHFATEFDSTRGRPWPGWERIADRFAPESAPCIVLDVGCGNGRFGAYMAGRRTGALHYLGLDGCAALLQAAERTLDGLVAVPTLRQLDVREIDLDRALGGERFDLIAIFAVLHHVPAAAARRHLLQQLGRLLTPTGMMAASIWRLDQTPRFVRRVVPWETYNQQRTVAGRGLLDLEALEAGDMLLSWGGDAEHPRYCHFPNEAEIETLVTTPEPRLVDRFESDGPSGRDNLYLVWQNQRRSSP